MLPELLPGLRNLRSAFLTGSLILGTLYIFFAHSAKGAASPRQPVEQILHLWRWMPLILIAAACFLVGSLYTNALEGTVDWIHRKRIDKDDSSIKSPVYRRILYTLAPLSASARGRLIVEARRFYDEYASAPLSSQARDDFQKKVLADVLWIEGKLAGSALEVPYHQYRSEGELQLGTALLLPFVSAAIGYAVRLQPWHLVILVILMTLVSIKLADYGLYYFRRAHSFVAHHVSDGAILTPSMETLKRTAAGRQTEKTSRPPTGSTRRTSIPAQLGDSRRSRS
jgi:hypothetical protein